MRNLELIFVINGCKSCFETDVKLKELKRRSLVKSLKTRAFDCQSAIFKTSLKIADWQSRARVFKLLTRERLFNQRLQTGNRKLVFLNS